MKKKRIIGMIIIILLVVLIPIPTRLKDGGTIEYKALFYKVSKVHALIQTEAENEPQYNEGIIIKILGFEIYNNVSSNKKEEKDNKDFELLFEEKNEEESKMYTILDKSETDKYDYNVYAYDGTVEIKIDGKKYSLKEALLENRITMEEIINKAKEDSLNALSYDDGGSMEYHYENYTIIKCHTLDGNRDVYIGHKNLRLNEVLEKE